MIKLGYWNADWLLVEYVEDYIPLSPEEQKALRREFGEYQKQHRQQRLPQYIAFLDFVHDAASDHLTSAEYDRIEQEIRHLLKLTLSDLLPVITPKFSALDDKKLRYMQAAFVDKNAEYSDRHLDGNAEEQRANRANRTLERFTEWLGPLSEKQQNLIKDLSNELPVNAAAWLAYRQSKQSEFSQLLRTQPDARMVDEFLRNWWLDREGLPLKLKQQGDAMWNGIKDMLLKVDMTLSDTQRQFFLKRLASFRDDLVDLADD